MNKTEKNKAIKEIKRLWNKAEYILNNKGWNRYGEELLSITREESKSHDRFRGQGKYRGITITEESKYFAIKRLVESLYFESLNNVIMPSLDDYHHTQKSVYMAYSLACEFQQQLKEVISLDNAKYINSLDYVELIQEVA